MYHSSFSHALYKRTKHINNSMVYWFQKYILHLRKIKHTQLHMSVFDIYFNVIVISIIHINLIKKALPAHCTHSNEFLSRYLVRGYSIFVHASLSHIFAHPHTKTHSHTHTVHLLLFCWWRRRRVVHQKCFSAPIQGFSTASNWRKSRTSLYSLIRLCKFWLYFQSKHTRKGPVGCSD